jgi:hypothetical protein
MEITITRNTVAGGKDVFIGDHVDVAGDEGKYLMSLRKAVKGHVDLNAKPTATVQEVIDAIDLLDPADKSVKTKDGKPECAALAEIIGKEVSAAIRDEAFAKVNE